MCDNHENLRTPYVPILILTCSSDEEWTLKGEAGSKKITSLR